MLSTKIVETFENAPVERARFRLLRTVLGRLSLSPPDSFSRHLFLRYLVEPSMWLLMQEYFYDRIAWNQTRDDDSKLKDREVE